MGMFKERLLTSFILFMIGLFVASFIVAMVFSIYWPWLTFISILVLLGIYKWIDWQFVEPYKAYKAEKDRKQGL